MAQQAKSIRQHLLHGTVPQGKPASPSAFTAGRPVIPKHLSPVARREFKRVCAFLERRATLTEGDVATIAVLSEVTARWIDCKRALGDQYTITTSIADNNGNLHTVVRPNPLIRIVQDCESKILSLTKSLGLTPDSRDKVKPTQLDTSLEIIPGSLADTNPELFGGNVTPKKPVAVDPEEMGVDE